MPEPAASLTESLCLPSLLMHASTLFACHNLVDLPNISFRLAEELTRVGLRSPDHLAQVGAENAWTRLREAGLHHDPYTLLALEGAIQRVAWQALPPARRHELLRVAA